MDSKATDVFERRPGGSCGPSLGSDRSSRLRFRAGAVCLALLVLLFGPTLIELASYAAHNELNSHILLVPFVTGWLLWIERRSRTSEYQTSVIGSAVLGGIGGTAVIIAAIYRGTLSTNDALALKALALAALLAAAGSLFLGTKWMKSAAFPAAFLVFMAPLPDAAVDWLEKASMLASAQAAAMFFWLTGTPMVHSGTVFELPRITLQVAQECSGIRSSWVLFITSLIASHLFLRTTWRRLFLIAFVIPLGVLRNGFRVLVIGLLCVHVGPYMIDSPIHHRGGPIFFVLSLLPLMLVSWWLRRQEERPNLSR